MMMLVIFIQVVRKLKSINSIRAKRKRYRNKKKDLQRLCKQWRERRVEYEAGITEDRIAAEVILKETAAKHLKEKKRAQEIHDMQMAELNNAYHQDCINSISDSGCLLMPSVRIPDLECITVSGTVSGIEKVTVKSYVATVMEERNEALAELKHYRDIAERLQKEKRQLHDELSQKCERVRDFWRNTLLEGGSRGGLMVRQALKLCRQKK